MNGPLAMILVVFVLALGFGACWAITAQGSATAPQQDTFGNNASAAIISQNNQSAGLAVAVMPVIPIAFMIAVCVVLVIAFAWLWKNGQYKERAGKYW